MIAPNEPAALGGQSPFAPDPAPRPAEPTFTVVFRGDVRRVGGNLFQVVQPFGEVIAIAIGDALAELDEAREKLGGTHAGD